jgi:hypothetical protein
MENTKNYIVTDGETNEKVVYMFTEAQAEAIDIILTRFNIDVFIDEAKLGLIED